MVALFRALRSVSEVRESKPSPFSSVVAVTGSTDECPNTAAICSRTRSVSVVSRSAAVIEASRCRNSDACAGVSCAARREEGFGGGVELDGVAEVLVPVLGVEFGALEVGAGEGGVVGDGGGAWGDGCEVVEEFVVELLHLG